MDKAFKTISTNFIIPCIIYPFDVLVSIGQTDEQVLSVLKRLGLEGEEEGLWKLQPLGLGRAAMFSNNGCFLRLRHLPDTSEDYGCLAHEIFHVATFVMHAIKTPLKVMKSDEPYAYLIGYLTTYIYKKINKYY